MSVLLFADVVIGVSLGLFFPVGYFSGKSVARITSDLAFVEGAAIFFAGGLMAFLRSSLSSTVKVLMIMGVVMLGLSIVFGMFI